MENLKVIIVTGLSGAGKTNAADWLEDRGYYCVDNMPPSLIKSFVDMSLSSRYIDKVAIIVDVRGGEFFDDLTVSLEQLEEHDKVDLKVLFMEASDQTLVHRYNETRRHHPMSKGPVDVELIKKERTRLKTIRNMSDYVVNTTGMRTAQLKNALQKVFGDEIPGVPFGLNFQSFGYKKGLPLEADMILDMRFIPNPFYVKSLKKLTGRNKRVQEYVLRHDVTQQFIDDFLSLIKTLIPCYQKEGKSHLNISFGCTGGQHRSVSMAEVMAGKFKKAGFLVTLEHRDIK